MSLLFVVSAGCSLLLWIAAWAWLFRQRHAARESAVNLGLHLLTILVLCFYVFSACFGVFMKR